MRKNRERRNHHKTKGIFDGRDNAVKMGLQFKVYLFIKKITEV